MTGLEILAISGLVSGTALQVGGQLSAASAQKDAAEAEFALKNEQADELLARQAINEKILRDQSELVQRDYQSKFAFTGKQGGGIGGVLRIKKELDENISNTAREAQFKASQLRKGATIDLNLASSYQTAAILGSVGSIFSTGVDAYNILKAPTTPAELAGGKPAASAAKPAPKQAGVK